MQCTVSLRKIVIKRTDIIFPVLFEFLGNGKISRNFDSFWGKILKISPTKTKSLKTRLFSL